MAHKLTDKDREDIASLVRFVTADGFGVGAIVRRLEIMKLEKDLNPERSYREITDGAG